MWAVSPLGYGCLKGSAHHRQVWDRHLVGYLDPDDVGFWTGPLPSLAAEMISWSSCSVHWSVLRRKRWQSLPRPPSS